MASDLVPDEVLETEAVRLTERLHERAEQLGHPSEIPWMILQLAAVIADYAHQYASAEGDETWARAQAQVARCKAKLAERAKRVESNLDKEAN